MKKFRLQPHEIGYLRLLYSGFAGMDYATANAETKMKSRKDSQIMKTIREVQIKTMEGLASEYIRAALIVKKLLTNDEKVFCVFLLCVRIRMMNLCDCIMWVIKPTVR